MERTVRKFLATYYDGQDNTFQKLKDLDLYDYVVHELVFYSNNKNSIAMAYAQYEYFVNNKMRLNNPDKIKDLDLVVFENKNGPVAKEEPVVEKAKKPRKKKTK